MSIDDSKTLDPLFISDQPDWGRGVVLIHSHITQIKTSRSGLEQRSRNRVTPMIRLEWTAGGLTQAEIKQRGIDDLAESRYPCVVPLWTEPVGMDGDMPDADTISIDTTPAAGEFEQGDWIYIDDGTARQFRQIETLADTDTFNLETHAAPTTFTGTVTVYPCRKFEKVIDGNTLQKNALRSGTAKRIFTSID